MSMRTAQNGVPNRAGPGTPTDFCPLPHALLEEDNRAGNIDLITLQLRLRQLESENLALKIQVNRLIISLSKTLLQNAAGSARP